MKFDFIVVAHPYNTRSGGIMVLHELCSALNRLNYRAGIIFFTAGSVKEQNWKFGFSNDQSLLDPCGDYYDYIENRSNEEIMEFIKNSCVIYPDIVRGNPIGAKNYVTYVLGKSESLIESPFILAFSEIYINSSDCILFKPFVSEFMNSAGTTHWSERKLSLTYIAKGQDYTECSVIPGTVLIEREWPRDKQQLAALLRNCRFFFSWDTVSATNTDAVLCGAVPVLMHDKQIPRSVLNVGELGPYPEIYYTPDMQVDYLPVNSIDISNSLNSMQIRIQETLALWIPSVARFANKVQNKLG